LVSLLKKEKLEKDLFYEVYLIGNSLNRVCWMSQRQRVLGTKWTDVFIFDTTFGTTKHGMKLALVAAIDQHFCYLLMSRAKALNGFSTIFLTFLTFTRPIL